jgi:hypothetical protein
MMEDFGKFSAEKRELGAFGQTDGARADGELTNGVPIDDTVTDDVQRDRFVFDGLFSDGFLENGLVPVPIPTIGVETDVLTDVVPTDVVPTDDALMDGVTSDEQSPTDTEPITELETEAQTGGIAKDPVLKVTQRTPATAANVQVPTVGTLTHRVPNVGLQRHRLEVQSVPTPGLLNSLKPPGSSSSPKVETIGYRKDGKNIEALRVEEIMQSMFQANTNVKVVLPKIPVKSCGVQTDTVEINGMKLFVKSKKNSMYMYIILISLFIKYDFKIFSVLHLIYVFVLIHKIK